MNWEGEGDSVGDMYGECNHLDEAISGPEYSEDCIVPVLVGQGWSSALGGLLLNLSIIFSDTITSFWNI